MDRQILSVGRHRRCLCAYPLRRGTDVLTSDTYDQSNPTNNYGALAGLVSNSTSVWIRFNLDSLPAEITGANVSNATLILFADRVSSAERIDVATANGPWMETTLMSENAPAITPVMGGTAAVAQTGQYIYFDVTSAVRSWVNAPAGNHGFQVSADGTTPNVSVILNLKPHATNKDLHL